MRELPTYPVVFEGRNFCSRFKDVEKEQSKVMREMLSRGLHTWKSEEKNQLLENPPAR